MFRFWRSSLLLAVMPLALGAAPPVRPAWWLKGERIYRQGRLPSGVPVPGIVRGDIPVPSEAMTCAHCHMWSGLGSTEGGVVTPPVHAPALFQPRYRALPRVPGPERPALGLTAPPLRPAYTDVSLAEALRIGIDPSGREFSDVMPRYDLQAPDMALLIRYLRSLSADLPPGVNATDLYLATIICPEVSVEDREAMLKPLQDYVAFQNKLPAGFDHRMFRSRAGRNLIADHRTLHLEPWVLSGPPASWPRQLEARYRKRPVFAFLGGIGYGAWQPIHAFCEAWRIPCLLPITDYPVVSETDWYTLYFSRGFTQEGETTAAYLADGLAASKGARIVQVVQGEPGRRLEAGFAAAWRELGRLAPATLRLAEGQALDPAALQALLRHEAPAALLLWTGPAQVEACRTALQAAAPALPLFISGGLWKAQVYELPEALRPQAFITYPYRHPEDEAKSLRNTVPSLSRTAERLDGKRITSRMYSLVQVFSKALMEMYGAFYRDNLFDRIAMLPDQSLPDFERLGFGPGQRYASKGCYVMQLSPGPEARLLKRSDWVVH